MDSLLASAALYAPSVAIGCVCGLAVLGGKTSTVPPLWRALWCTVQGGIAGGGAAALAYMSKAETPARILLVILFGLGSEWLIGRVPWILEQLAALRFGNGGKRGDA